MASDTRLPVSEETRDRLRERKRGGETYDDVVTRLLDETAERPEEYRVPLVDPSDGSGWDEEVVAGGPREAMAKALNAADDRDVMVASTFLRDHGLLPDSQEAP